jgi:hypothetical protein
MLLTCKRKHSGGSACTYLQLGKDFYHKWEPSPILYIQGTHYFTTIYMPYITPFFSFYKARRDMARSSKLDFTYLFLLYYIFYGYKHIIIRKYIWYTKK